MGQVQDDKLKKANGVEVFMTRMSDHASGW